MNEIVRVRTEIESNNKTRFFKMEISKHRGGGGCAK